LHRPNDRPREREVARRHIRFIDAPEPLLLFTLTPAPGSSRSISAPNRYDYRYPLKTPTLLQIDCPGPVNGRTEGRELRLPGQSTIYARVF